VTVRHAACQCGQLSLVCRGAPIRISVCHCLDCQRRSGSVFAAQARFPAEAVTVTGEAQLFSRTGDSGSTADQYFCATCGSTLYYRLRRQADVIAVPIGAFADPTFPPPRFSVYEERRHPWVAVIGEDIAHHE